MESYNKEHYIWCAGEKFISLVVLSKLLLNGIESWFVPDGNPLSDFGIVQAIAVLPWYISLSFRPAADKGEGWTDG